MNQDGWNAGGVTILWQMTNGLLMGILLCSPKRYWPAYVATGGIIDFLFNMSLHDPLSIGAYLSACNMLEAALGAMLLYPVLAAKPNLTQRKQLVAFLGYGGPDCAPGRILGSFFRPGLAVCRADAA